MDNFGPVSLDVLGRIASAILGALLYLHEQHSIVHCALKPSNILVNSRGEIRLGDFNVSRELEEQVEPAMSTMKYMAPEYLQGSPHTIKSDIWSFGLTLLELAIGSYPYSASTDGLTGSPRTRQDLANQIVLKPAPVFPFPGTLAALIAYCLEKDAEQRPTSQELCVCLHRALMGRRSDYHGRETTS